MTEISLVGLGLMGSALGRALLAGGRSLTVWNRSAEKMRPLAAQGAQPAGSLAEAIEASPATIVCVDNYATTHVILGAPDVAPPLRGKTLIQLSTGTPREAREAAAWAKERGAGYLDGAILAGPEHIGPSALILVAGPTAAFDRCKPALACLAGDLRHVGERIGSAAALDLAWLSEYFGFFLGAIHGARMCEAEQVGIDQYSALFAEGSQARWLLDIIQSGDYTHPTATLAVWYEALRRVQRQAQDAGINCEIPDFAAGFFKRAIAAGYGEEEVAALVKVLR